MTLRDTILAYLSGLPRGATDTEREMALAVKHHSQVNQRCRQLAAAGLIERREIGPNRFRNFYVAKQDAASPQPDSQPEQAAAERPWFWEGNVQARIVRYLVEGGWNITRVADTSSREPGKDVTASKRGRELWVSVKGRPQGTEKTAAFTQARVWFHAAVFDLIQWRGESDDAELMIAVPDFVTYRNLATRIEWLARIAHFRLAWVEEDGSVI